MFPCTMGCCLRSAAISLLWITPFTSVLGADSGRAVINPLVTLGKLTVALFVVLAVFWLFSRVMRQFQGFQGGMHQGLKVIGALSVGQREKVIVIQAGEDQLVLGVTSTQINTLHVLGNPLETGLPKTDTGEFRNKLTAALKRQVVTE